MVGQDMPRSIAVIGAPIDMGASQRGTLMGPAALRTAGLLTLLEGLGFDVTDHGDLSVAGMADLDDPPPDKTNHYREIQRWTRAAQPAAAMNWRDPARSRSFLAAIIRCRWDR